MKRPVIRSGLRAEGLSSSLCDCDHAWRVLLGSLLRATMNGLLWCCGLLAAVAASTTGPPTTSTAPNRKNLLDGPLEFEDILPDNPKEYDKMQPPKEEGKPTVVYFHVTVMSLDSIDESSMTFAADIFFAQSWKDSRLRLPDNMTSEYRLLPVSWLKLMWRPDSFFKNAKKVTFQEMTVPNHYIWLYQDKTILYMVKLTLILSCAMNFKSYPHDTQQCAMKIESLSHTTDDLVFIWDPIVPLVVDDRIELPQLDIVNNATGDCTQLYSTGNFTCLEVSFTLKRRLGYYLFHTYVPTCLIVIMSWISFWLKPEAVPARVTLGVTSLLTLSTQHANSQKSLPPVSYIKAIDVFMSSCTVFVFCSLMEYALVNIILGDLIDDAENPVMIRKMVKKLSQSGQGMSSGAGGSNDGPLGSSCNNQAKSNGGGSETTELMGPPPPPPPGQPGYHGALPPPISERLCRQQARHQRRRDRALFIDRFSRVFFPLSFSVLNIMYWTVFVEYYY
ncbi:glycine receptor subunit alpha-2-like isoform X2 [Neocloeon triangulifer]|uniref:glycine receptor subunit alpha-2-like isoform X2 n=1 Tax=Neocloeon triangulifer TaxID=2078957 RepID=UPI00286F754D|nr:glycine receptor subunit alpha-2-like isoform X2 [Neocloeon triangulifer]